MENSFQLPSIVLTSLLTIMVAIPCYGKHGKKADSGVSKTPSDNSTATNATVSFSIRSSQINDGRWCQTSMKASAGQSVEIRVTTLEELKNPKAKPGRIQFRAKGDNNPSCSVSFDKNPKAGQTQTTSLTMSLTGPVEYATEGSLSATVSMKLGGTRHGGVHEKGDSSNGEAGTLPCPQCRGTGKYTAFTTPSYGARHGVNVNISCPTCNGTGRATQSAIDFYWKSKRWGDRNVENTP